MNFLLGSLALVLIIPQTAPVLGDTAGPAAGPRRRLARQGPGSAAASRRGTVSLPPTTPPPNQSRRRLDHGAIGWERCTDNHTFIDIEGYSCTMWTGFSCAYSADPQLQAQCPFTCGLCPADSHIWPKQAEMSFAAGEATLLSQPPYLSFRNGAEFLWANLTDPNTQRPGFQRGCCVATAFVGTPTTDHCFSPALRDECLALRPCFNTTEGCTARLNSGFWPASGPYAHCNDGVAAVKQRHAAELQAIMSRTGPSMWKVQGIDTNPCDVCFPPPLIGFDQLGYPGEASTCTTVSEKASAVPLQYVHVPRLCMTRAPGLATPGITEGDWLTGFDSSIYDATVQLTRVKAKDYIRQSKSPFLAGFSGVPQLPRRIEYSYPQQYFFGRGRFEVMLSNLSPAQRATLHYFHAETAIYLRSIVTRHMTNSTSAFAVMGFDTDQELFMATQAGICHMAIPAQTDLPKASIDCSCMSENRYGNDVTLDELTVEGQTCCLHKSEAILDTGLALVMTQDTAKLKDQNVYLTFMSIFINPTVINSFLFCLLLIIIVGHLGWFFERHENSDEFPPSYVDGIDDGIWWATVTFMTVGYGDKSPRSSTARVISLFWMFMGLGAYGYVTGTISNVMSADMVQSIETWTDLAHSKKVVCSALSTSQHREFFDGTIYFPPATVDGFTVEKLNGFAACFDRLELPEDDPQHVDAILFDYRMAQNLIGSLNEDVATAKAADPGLRSVKYVHSRVFAARGISIYTPPDAVWAPHKIPADWQDVYAYKESATYKRRLEFFFPDNFFEPLEKPLNAGALIPILVWLFLYICLQVGVYVMRKKRAKITKTTASEDDTGIKMQEFLDHGSQAGHTSKAEAEVHRLGAILLEMIKEKEKKGEQPMTTVQNPMAIKVANGPTRAASDEADL